MEIVQTTALITINETLGVQILLFLVFLLVIDRLMFRPVRHTLKAREDHGTELARQSAELEAELERLAAQAAEEEDRVRALARREREELRAAGQEAAGEVVRDALAEIERLKAEGEARITEGLTEARQRLESESHAVAAAMLAKILDGRRE